MEKDKILQSDILDILFDGRNKGYGAYQLRKSYNKRVTTALIGTLIICASIVLTNVFANPTDKNEKTEIFVQDMELQDMQQEVKKVEPPPPQQQEIQKIETIQFTAPLVSKDQEVNDDEQIKEVEFLEDTKIGLVNQDGIKDEGIVAPIIESKGTGIVEAPKVVEAIDEVFTVVQIAAEFPGGLAAWQKYLERNLNRDLPVDQGAPSGKYTVTVSFIVDKTGNISDVKAENNPGFGTAEEAVRVIKKGPNWKPAIQNGKNVIYRHKQNITFLVAEN